MSARLPGRGLRERCPSTRRLLDADERVLVARRRRGSGEPARRDQPFGRVVARVEWFTGLERTCTRRRCRSGSATVGGSPSPRRTIIGSSSQVYVECSSRTCSASSAAVQPLRDRRGLRQARSDRPCHCRARTKRRYPAGAARPQAEASARFVRARPPSRNREGDEARSASTLRREDRLRGRN